MTKIISISIILGGRESRIRSGPRSMERRRRVRERKENNPTSSQAIVSYRKYTCRDSPKRRNTKTSLPPPSPSSTIFDSLIIYLFLILFICLKVAINFLIIVIS